MRESGGFLPNIFLGADESALTCSTRPKRPRLSQCWRCCTVATSRSRAPSGRSGGRLGLSGKLFFCRFLPNIFLGRTNPRSRAPRGRNDLGFLKCWRSCTVGTSRSRAPSGRSRDRLGLSGKCFLKQLPMLPIIPLPIGWQSCPRLWLDFADW